MQRFSRFFNIIYTNVVQALGYNNLTQRDEQHASVRGTLSEAEAKNLPPVGTMQPECTLCWMLRFLFDVLLKLACLLCFFPNGNSYCLHAWVFHTYSQLLGIDAVYVKVLLCYAIYNNLSYHEEGKGNKTHTHTQCIVLKRLNNSIIHAGKPQVPGGGRKVSRGAKLSGPLINFLFAGFKLKAPPSLSSSFYQYS